jgi:exonuclease SbcD
MKILHTADWHIGKVLHKYALRDELLLFFDWLVELIKSEQVDLLLVSGDIFDLANPAVVDREVYYKLLSRLIKLDVEVIITGGNHDAVGLLNAPQTVLNELKITVVGGAEEDLNDELIEVKNAEGELELVVAAVPFLRDKDLRSKEIDAQYANRTEAIREGVKKHYADLSDICAEKYPEIPIIAMGHLYAKGVTTSDSERDIHIGNAAAIDSSIFSDVYDYVALGHIHRPQIVDKSDYIRYSGSPIALSFSEKTDKKSLVIIEVSKGIVAAPQVIEIPKFRSLSKFSGDLETVKKKVEAFKPNYPLISFVEIEVTEQTFSALTLQEVDALVSKYQDSEQFIILKARTTFTEKAKDTAALFEEGEHIEDLQTIDVFEKMMAQQDIPSEDQITLKEAFLEIMELVNQEAGE